LGLCLVVAGLGADAPAPHLPFEDWGACPFESCRYAEWSARKPAILYDTWRATRHETGRIETGEKFQALRGVVITFRPGVVQMDRDLPEYNLKAGETILTYAYRGEGYSAVWFHGKYDPEFDLTFARNMDGTGCGREHCAARYVDAGEKVWWAEVRLGSGKTGWVDVTRSELNFP
jgi:hypothetical protein